MMCQAPIKKNPEVSDFRKNWCKSSRGEIFYIISYCYIMRLIVRKHLQIEFSLSGLTLYEIISY